MIKMHAYPEAVVYQVEKCNAKGCEGGKVYKRDKDGNRAGKPHDCPNCQGSGYVSGGVYGTLTVDISRAKALMEDGGAPNGFPKEYVQKDIAPLDFAAKVVDDLLFKGYQALSMQHIADVPLNESGKAKELDRDELNGYLYGIARRIKQHYLYTAWHFLLRRYYSAVAVIDLDNAKAQMPAVKVPETFDVVSAANMKEELFVSQTEKLPPSIVKAKAVQYINKEYEGAPRMAQQMVLAQKLNPLAGWSREDVSNAGLDGSISKVDAVTYYYIEQFVERALEDDPEFLDKPRPEQRQAIKALAREKLAEISPAQAPASGTTLPIEED
jgi:hypothetical protein